MKKMILASAIFVTSSIQAEVDGYKDIYIDPTKDIKVHSIFCSKDLNNVNQLKPNYVFTTEDKIEKGTYYYRSGYGDFSYTFKPLPEKPDHVLVRGLLKNGQTEKSQMTLDLCIVKAFDGLPKGLQAKLGYETTQVTDANWPMYATLIGKPAFAKGVYKH